MVKDFVTHSCQYEYHNSVVTCEKDYVSTVYISSCGLAVSTVQFTLATLLLACTHMPVVSLEALCASINFYCIPMWSLISSGSRFCMPTRILASSLITGLCYSLVYLVK